MSRTKYKAAVIGTGFIGAGSHIPAYQAQADRCEIVAIADIRPEQAEYVATRNGIERYYSDSLRMLEECKPDVVSICVPNNDHKALSIAALKAGANVLCEKPITTSVADAKEIYDTARAVGRLFMPVQNDRMGKRTVVRDMVRDGLLGDVYFAECENVRRRGIPNWGEFHIKDRNFGGPFCDVGVHFIDSILFILGNPKFEAISGKTWAKIAPFEKDEVNLSRVTNSPNFLARQYAAEEFTVEDHAAGTIRLAGDLMINFKFSWALNSPPFDGIRLSGTKAGLVFDKYAQNEFKLYSQIGETMTDTVLHINPNHRFSHLEYPGIWLMVDHYLDVLDGKAEPLITEAEALNVVSIIEAFYRSAEQNREITAEELQKI